MFRDRHFHRSGRWHAPPAPDAFGFVSTPTIIELAQTTCEITWRMNEVCTGRIEYGPTGSYGSATTEQSIGGGYSRHVQTISGLSANTLYHFRTKSTNATGTTVYSDDATFTTAAASSETVGPGATPALPATYVTVPGSIATDGSDVSAAMQTFINSVPDGSTIVFNETPGTPKTYTFAGATTAAGILLSNRSNLTLWGYGTRLHSTRTDGNIAGSCICIRRGSQGITILGFELSGVNTPSNLLQLSSYLAGESSMGVAIYAAQRVTVRDCTIHHVNGDGIYVSGNYTTEGDTDGGKGWTTVGPWDFSHNYIHHTGRQGITYNWGSLTADWNLLEDIGAWPFDAEDGANINRTMPEVRIRHNVMRRWNWWTGYVSRPINLSHDIGQLQPIDYFEVSDNEFHEGPMGYGRPSSGYGSKSGSWLIAHSGSGGALSALVRELVIVRNTCTLDAEIIGDNVNWGAVRVYNQGNLTIRDNDFDGMRIRHIGTTGTVDIANNGSSVVSTS